MKVWKHEFFLSAVVLLLSSFTFIAFAQSTPIAALTGVSGDVNVIRADGKTTVKGKLNLPIYEGDTIKVAKGSATVWFISGGIKTVKPAQPLLVTRKVETAKAGKFWKAFRQKSSSSFRDENLTLVGATRASVDPSQVLLLSPRNTRLLEAPMSFKWSKVESADAYFITVGVFEGKGPEDRLWYNAVAETELKWPSDAPKFQAGKTYIWEVAAIKGDETLSSETAWFSLLSKSQIQRVKDGERDIANDKNIDSESIRHLLLAALYEDSELYVDTERELKSIQEVPEHKDMVHLMLGDLYRKIGLDLFAGVEFSKVDPSLVGGGWE
jgi:hypothetical protein